MFDDNFKSLTHANFQFITKVLFFVCQYLGDFKEMTEDPSVCLFQYISIS